MKPILTIILFLLAGASAKSQTDPHAKAILDQVSAKNKAYKTISTSFTITGNDIKNNENSSQKGSLLIKGTKYVIKLTESEIYFDGKDVYNYLPASKEVNITKPQASNKEGNDFFISNPRDVFTIYQKNFKNKFIKETTAGGKPVYEIDLYPIDLKKKYNRIRLHVDKENYLLTSVKAFYKDGQQYTITFDKFIINNDIPDKTFIFDPASHPGIEVVDLRF